MATERPSGQRPGSEVPGVRPDLKKSIDPSYDASQEGSTPLASVSVDQCEERSVWPIVWAVTTIVMVLLAIYFVVG